MSSWEIFVSAFRHGDPNEFETADLRDVLERGTIPHPTWSPPNSDFFYEDGYLRTNVVYLGPRAGGFVVERIFGQTAVARLLEAAACFHGLIFWPASPPDALSAVACEATFAHLPKGVIADVEPVLTDGPLAFIEAVGFSTKMTKQEWLDAEARRERWHWQDQHGFRPKS